MCNVCVMCVCLAGPPAAARPACVRAFACACACASAMKEKKGMNSLLKTGKHVRAGAGELLGGVGVQVGRIYKSIYVYIYNSVFCIAFKFRI